MWKDHPLQGIRLNNFTYLCKNDQRYKNLLKNIGCVTHPHNFYLQWYIYIIQGQRYPHVYFFDPKTGFGGG